MNFQCKHVEFVPWLQALQERAAFWKFLGATRQLGNREGVPIIHVSWHREEYATIGWIAAMHG